jgi:hypothetical protein
MPNEYRSVGRFSSASGGKSVSRSRAPPLARDLHGPQQRLQRARTGPLVGPLHPVGADDWRSGRRLRAPVEMRLQQLPHHLPPLLLQQGFEIAVGHARRLL